MLLMRSLPFRCACALARSRPKAHLRSVSGLSISELRLPVPGPLPCALEFRAVTPKVLGVGFCQSRPAGRPAGELLAAGFQGLRNAASGMA